MYCAGISVLGWDRGKTLAYLPEVKIKVMSSSGTSNNMPENDKKKRKRITQKQIVSLLVLLVLIVFFGRFISNNWDEFSQIEIRSPQQVVFIVGFFLLNLFLQGTLNTIILKALNIKMGITESAALVAVARFGDYFLPMKGGMTTKAVYLKQKHDCDYGSFLAQSSAGLFAGFLVAGFMGFAALLVLKSNTEINDLIFLLFGGVSVVTFVILVWNPDVPNFNAPLLSKTLRIVHGWNMTRGKLRIQAQFIALNCFFIFFRAGSIYFQFKFFGIEVGYFAALFLAATGPFQTLVSITPAGLGVREVILVFSATLIGVGAEITLAVALLGRLLRFLTLIALSPISSWYLLKRKPDIAPPA